MLWTNNMGRYGVGHGALAIRARERKRRRLRRNTLGGDGVYYPRPENYIHFYNQTQRRRKYSNGSSQSAPVKGADEDASLTIMPGQVPHGGDNQEVLSLPVELTQPGPSWWPGPPFQQGGMIMMGPSKEEVASWRATHLQLVDGPTGKTDEPPQQGNSGSGFLANVVGVFTGMDTWQQIQARLMPQVQRATIPQQLGDPAATKGSQHVSFQDEVGSGNHPLPPSLPSFSNTITHCDLRQVLSGPLPHWDLRKVLTISSLLRTCRWRVP